MNAIRPPSPRAVEAAFSALAEARDRLLTEYPDMPEEQQLYQDMLEGEAQGDPLEVIDRLVNCAVDAETLAEGVRLRRTDLAERLARFTRRAEQMRKIAQQMLEALQISRLERPTFSAVIGRGPVHVIPTAEPKDLPPRFQRVSIEANKTALAEALKAGEDGTPATWSNPQPVLTIRVR